MKLFMIGYLWALTAVLFTVAFNAPFKPGFNHAHDAFVCNGTICRDKMSVLPVSWQRYVSLP